MNPEYFINFPGKHSAAEKEKGDFIKLTELLKGFPLSTIESRLSEKLFFYTFKEGKESLSDSENKIHKSAHTNTIRGHTPTDALKAEGLFSIGVTQHHHTLLEQQHR